ncbi:hypothetical protein EVAR_80085_1 [Eumeta japonica]|uniref:Uncharacterized protein n=1 Tax=Eumeta variegata TaxID=151549 RepID=A0A4C1UE26_EUMVA|nr:hypothetical protein EVAR_80085_1 [Eumeta japonica]
MAIYNRLAELKRRRVNLSDKFCDGCPATAVNNKNIDAVRRMIKTDRQVLVPVLTYGSKNRIRQEKYERGINDAKMLFLRTLFGVSSKH